MATEPQTFEDNLKTLESIVSSLERGDVPLEEALAQFQTGVQLSQKLQKTLNEAERTLTKLIDNQGQEVPFDASDAK